MTWLHHIWDTPRLCIYMWHDLLCDIPLVCDMTHHVKWLVLRHSSCVCHDTLRDMTYFEKLLIYVTWLVMWHDSFWDDPHVCDMYVTLHIIWHDVFLRRSSWMWHDSSCDMTYFKTLLMYVTWNFIWHDSSYDMTHFQTLLIYVAWYITWHVSLSDTPSVCDMTHNVTWLIIRHSSCVWHDSSCAMTHFETLPMYVTWRNIWHDSVEGISLVCGMIHYVTWLIIRHSPCMRHGSFVGMSEADETAVVCMRSSVYGCYDWIVYETLLVCVYMCDVTICMWRDYIFVTWLYICDMTIYMWHDWSCDIPLICDMPHDVTWLVLSHSSRMCHGLHEIIRVCVPWLLFVCDMNRSLVWHDSFICVTWLIHRNEWSWWNCGGLHEIICVWVLRLNRIWDTPRLCIHMWHDYMYVTWLYICDMTIHMWHEIICVRVLWLNYIWDTPRLWHQSYMNESCHRYQRVMSHVMYVYMWHDMWHVCVHQLCYTWMSHVTDVTESCRMYASVMLHMDESCHRYHRVMSHVCISYVTHGWVMSRIWRSLFDCVCGC